MLIWEWHCGDEQVTLNATWVEEYVTDVGEHLKKTCRIQQKKQQKNASDMIASLDFEMQQAVAALTRVNTPYKPKIFCWSIHVL